MDFTVTVAGPERHDGEKPFTYVVDALSPDEAASKVLALHKQEQDTNDVLLVEVIQGIPVCGYYWNDLR